MVQTLTSACLIAGSRNQAEQQVSKLAFVRGAIFYAILVVFSLTSALAGEANGCNIKGNVSTRGERIYHVPGQKYYDETRISASHGERWFCSEDEARAAGWRRSRV